MALSHPFCFPRMEIEPKPCEAPLPPGRELPQGLALAHVVHKVCEWLVIRVCSWNIEVAVFSLENDEFQQVALPLAGTASGTASGSTAGMRLSSR